VGTRASGRSPWSASTLFIQPFKNAVLSRNLDQNMLKNAYFWKKLQNRCSVKCSAPRTPVGLRRLGAPPTGATALLLSPTAITFVEYVSSIGRTLLLRKITEDIVNVLVLFFLRFRAFFSK